MYAAALRHFIKHPGQVYIAVDWENDPPSDLLLHLSDLPGPLYGISRAKCSSTGVWDIFSLQAGVLHSLDKLEWTAEGNVKLIYTEFYGGLAAMFWEVTMAKTDSGWKVVDVRLSGIA